MIKITATQPDAWKELCLIGVIPDGGSEVQFAGMTEDISAMDWMEKPMSTVQLVNGGHIAKFDANTKESITMKVYPIKADDATTDQVVQFFHKQGTADTTNPIAVDNTLTRQKFGLILLWATTLPASGNASAQPAAAEVAYRIQVINAYMTKYKPSFDGKIFSAEVTFEWPPFAKDATRNKREESQDNSGAQLPAGITSATSF